MALIKCSECGKEFSDKAQACPSCACPVTYIKEEKKNIEPQNEVKEELNNGKTKKLDDNTVGAIGCIAIVVGIIISISFKLSGWEIFWLFIAIFVGVGLISGDTDITAINKDKSIKYTKILESDTDKRKSFTSTAMRGVVGGVALGPIGTVAGVLSGKKKTKKEVTFLIVYNNGKKETKCVEPKDKLYKKYIQYLKEE